MTARRPEGEPVDGGPAVRPVADAIDGRFVRLEPLDPEAHAPGSTSDRTRRHRGRGDLDVHDLRAVRRARGDARLVAGAVSTDLLFFTVVDRDAAEPIGVVSLMSIDPAMRRLELGNIWYVRSAQRGVPTPRRPTCCSARRSTRGGTGAPSGSATR